MSRVLILTLAGDLQAVIDDFEEIEWSRDFFRPGAARMRINRNKTGVPEILKGRIMGPSEKGLPAEADHYFLIEQIENEIDAGGRASETLLVSGRSIGGLLEDRLIIPPAGFSHDEFSGAAESVMKHYVSNHAGPSAPANRQYPGLVVATDLARGASTSFAGRYQTVQKALEEIATETHLGWEINFDPLTGDFTFDVIEGVDHTSGSAEPIFFDVAFETIIAQRWLTTDVGRKTFAYVAGQGEGADRTVIERFVGALEPTGFARKELFVDARDISTVASLQSRGDTKLQETVTEDFVEVDPNRVGPFQYPDDWDLGDLITVQNTKWGFQKDMRIIRVSLRIVPRSGVTEVKVQLDRPFPTLQDRIRRQGEEADAGRRV